MTDAAAVVLVVDAANVVGARPDGWWRDRAGAAERLLAQLAGLPGAVVPSPDGAVRVVAVAVVLEGRARSAALPAAATSPAGGLQVLLADGSGDDAVVVLEGELARAVAPQEAEVVVVTADRGLRARLTSRCWGPGWLRDLLDARATTARGVEVRVEE
ncbi:hypothetical protein WDV85_10670 [Pseudokineococcus sp. 5B2Z-1]|uniref:hypothetical protein n=1 Tax=Pseudokineococcus sp. 5B2Z-1 TaxID=3132744 RepID=UPI0030A037F9